METEAPYTFKDLKDAVNKLTDEQLAFPVMVSRESESLKISELAIVQ